MSERVEYTRTGVGAGVAVALVGVAAMHWSNASLGYALAVGLGAFVSVALGVSAAQTDD